MLNNCLGEPELNRLGLHALAPGTRLASNMAPSVARHDGGASLAVGSPGADRITTALMQVLARHCLLGVPLQEAIDAPRVHVRIEPDGSPSVQHEDDDAVLAALEQEGLPAVRTGRGRCSSAGSGPRCATTTARSRWPATPGARPRPASAERRCASPTGGQPAAWRHAQAQVPDLGGRGAASAGGAGHQPRVAAHPPPEEARPGSP